MRRYFWPLFFIFIASALLTFFLIHQVDPTRAKPWQMAAFYSLVFLGVFSLISLLGFCARVLVFRNGTRYFFYRTSIRQGVLLGLLAVVVLMLSAVSIFSFWTAVLLLVILSLIELYAVSL